ncbi:hypothetical protein C8R45DRAFT_1148406 [Mycena sanguinolenta]|nr:hypothetical protein C8R45DRAFT_1148406 [Mycena sanguinolenta]
MLLQTAYLAQFRGNFHDDFDLASAARGVSSASLSQFKQQLITFSLLPLNVITFCRRGTRRARCMVDNFNYLRMRADVGPRIQEKFGHIVGQGWGLDFSVSRVSTRRWRPRVGRVPEMQLFGVRQNSGHTRCEGGVHNSESPSTGEAWFEVGNARRYFDSLSSSRVGQRGNSEVVVRKKAAIDHVAFPQQDGRVAHCSLARRVRQCTFKKACAAFESSSCKRGTFPSMCRVYFACAGFRNVPALRVLYIPLEASQLR